MMEKTKKQLEKLNFKIKDRDKSLNSKILDRE